jgi:hypothetical protein
MTSIGASAGKGDGSLGPWILVRVTAGRAARSLRSRPYGSPPSAGPAACEALDAMPGPEEFVSEE